MFCPRCSTENKLNQGYCRQCGQELSSVRLALEGSAGQSLEKLKASTKWISAGTATITALTLVALAIAITSFALGDATLSYSALINLLLGLVVGLPLIFVGRSNLKQAVRLLSKSQTQSGHSVLEQAQPVADLVTAGLETDLNRLPAQGSVTEHTTLNLKGAERVPRKPG